jgi:beta-lactamase class D
VTRELTCHNKNKQVDSFRVNPNLITLYCAHIGFVGWVKIDNPNYNFASNMGSPKVGLSRAISI